MELTNFPSVKRADYLTNTIWYLDYSEKILQAIYATNITIYFSKQ